MYRIRSLFIAFFLVFSFQLNVFAAEDQPLTIISEAAALLDSETGAILYAKNADVKMFPASLTKIATAIYAIEKGNLDSIATVSANAVRQDGTRVYLIEGEQVPLKKLIQGMLINSGNDAAVAIAEHIDGSVEKFSENINEYLKTTIGVKNTHFTNPSGLHDDNHYTTAMDMALMTNYAIKNPIFAEIFGTKELVWAGQSWNTTILSHHRMLLGELAYPGTTGGKTGFTSVAKQTLATTADNGKIKLTAVVLKSEFKNDKYKDTASLFDYGFNSYYNSFLKQGETFTKDDKEFYLDKDTVITEEMNVTTKEVGDNGILLIKAKNGHELQKIQLEYKAPIPEPKQNVTTAKSDKPKDSIDRQFTEMNAIYGIMVIAFAGILISMRKKFIKKY